MKKDKLKKIRVKKLKNGFILVCPKCGYSFRPGSDPKHKRNKKTRCPMCGYEWYHSHKIDRNSQFPT